MADNRWRVFIDTNILISGLYSRTGASSALLDLGEAEEIIIVISQQVLVEADRVILKKFPHLIDRFREFIKNLSPLLVDDPSVEEIHKAKQIIIDPNDAPILAAAKLTPVDYLITLDTKHFHTPKVRAYLKPPVLKPSEFLDVFRKFWEEENQ